MPGSSSLVHPAVPENFDDPKVGAMTQMMQRYFENKAYTALWALRRKSVQNKRGQLLYTAQHVIPQTELAS